jgi:anti-sigma-K factor RskA
VSAAAGLLAAVVLGLGLIVARGVLPTQGSAPDTPAAVLAQQADRIVDDARSRDPGLRSAILRDQTGDAAAVVLDPGDEAAPVRLVPLALAPAGPAREYVVWATGLPGNTPVAVAVMDPDDGLTRPVDTASTPTRAGGAAPRGFAVSVEPSGPVPPRPSTVVAVGLTVA